MNTMISKLHVSLAVVMLAFAVPSSADDCSNCGTVKSIDKVKENGGNSATGMIVGGVIGGVVGNQFGSGSGRTLATVGGAAAGAYAGNEIAKNSDEKKYWKVVVSMDAGGKRTFKLGKKPDLANGDRVSIVDNKPLRVQTGH